MTEKPKNLSTVTGRVNMTRLGETCQMLQSLNLFLDDAIAQVKHD
jgi:hypothetical protein